MSTLGIEERATRTTAVIAVFLAVLMLGLPSSYLGDRQVNLNPVDNVTAAPGNRVLTIGWPGFTTTITTLNPLMYTTESERMTIWSCYSFLFTRDINGKMMGDLVTSYGVSQDGKTWNFNLVHTARFYDKNAPAVEHNLTASDVIYTFWLVQNTSGNQLQSCLPVVNGQPIIQNMWTPAEDPYHLYIQLSTVYAPIMNALASIPILPEYVWSTQIWNWDNFRTRAPICAPIIGSGPFYYMLDGKPLTGVVELGRSPTWFATEEKGWQLHVNKLVVRTSTDPQLLIYDYLDGLYDIIMFVPPGEFNSSLPGLRFAVSSGAVYEFNLNQMSNTLRAAYPAFRHGSNNQLLLDPVVKKALAMMIDKQGFIDAGLNGLGTIADSLCPDVSPWHYTYPNPIQFNISRARQDLWNAGWRYDTSGNPISATSTVYPVCKVGGTDPLRFRFWTLDTSPEWDVGGRLIATWAARGGVDLWYDYKAQNTAFMNGAWANADYDTWLWDWMFSPTSDVSTDVMQLLTTEAIGSWSDVFYSNKTYDNTYNASLVEVDPVVRKVLTDKLQALAYEDMGCQLVAYRKDLFAASSLGPDHWELGSYGNWQTQYTLKPDQLYPWLYMQLEPADNHAPMITGFATYYPTTATTDTPMTGSALDDHGGVEYRWVFGDGTNTSWLSNPAVTHRYIHDGYYTAYMAVRELVGTDNFVTWKAADVVVMGYNTAPHDLHFTYAPADPNTGDVVQFSGMATDDEGDPLTYSWTFGDGGYANGQNVTHQFTHGAASYTVTMHVDDGHISLVPRPVTYSRAISVAPNSPPVITVPDVAGILKGSMNIYLVTSSDQDLRDEIRYTWNWGDGSALQVTTVNQASHAYWLVSTFTLTVWADDLTGLPGHNVSDQGIIELWHPNHLPIVTQFVKDIANVVTGQVVMFTGTVIDVDGDPCMLTFDFGDGTNSTLFQIAPNTTAVASHTYSVGGPKTAYLFASDGVYTVQSTALNFVVNMTFTLNLATGWNLVSLPRVGYGYKASTLGLNPGDMVAEWNPLTKSYRSYIVGVPVNDFVIAPSTGYWINVPNGTRTLIIQGAVPSDVQSRDITVPAGGGWALIGFVGLNTTRHASDIPKMFSNGSLIIVSPISRWIPWLHTYTNWITTIPSLNNFLLVPGEGYWVFVSASGTLTYTP